MKMQSRNRSLIYYVGPRLMVIWALTVCFAVTAAAGSSISARYLQPRGKYIVWEIHVPSPPPAAVLVMQYILPGSDILETSHPLSSYDKKTGIAKWLLTSIPSGTLKMDMKISRPIRQKGEIHGEVMFQDESHKTTASIFMEPRTVRKALEGC